MVHVAVRGLRYVDPVAARHVPDGVRIAGEELPASEIGAKRLRVHFSTSGVSRSGSTVMETNAIFVPKSVPADPARTTSSG